MNIPVAGRSRPNERQPQTVKIAIAVDNFYEAMWQRTPVVKNEVKYYIDNVICLLELL